MCIRTDADAQFTLRGKWSGPSGPLRGNGRQFVQFAIGVDVLENLLPEPIENPDGTIAEFDLDFSCHYPRSLLFLFRAGDCSPARFPSLQQALLVREGRALVLDLDRHAVHPDVRALLEGRPLLAVADFVPECLEQGANVLLPTDAAIFAVVLLQALEELEPVDGSELGVVIASEVNALRVRVLAAEAHAEAGFAAVVAVLDDRQVADVAEAEVDVLALEGSGRGPADGEAEQDFGRLAVDVVEALALVRADRRGLGHD